MDQEAMKAQALLKDLTQAYVAREDPLPLSDPESDVVLALVSNHTFSIVGKVSDEHLAAACLDLPTSRHEGVKAFVGLSQPSTQVELAASLRFVRWVLEAYPCSAAKIRVPSCIFDVPLEDHRDQVLEPLKTAAAVGQSKNGFGRWGN